MPSKSAKKRARRRALGAALPQASSGSMAIVPVSPGQIPNVPRRRRNNAARSRVITNFSEVPMRTAFGRMNIQGDEMEVFSNAAKMVNDDDMSASYLRTLVNPSSAPARIPDSEVRSTSLAQSVQIIDLPIQLDTSINSGRFSVLVQPHLGSLNDPTNYAVAAVSAATWATKDWTQSTAYLAVNNGQDVRIDPNSCQLTSSNPSYAFWQAGGTLTPGQPFGTAPTVGNGYGLIVTYENTGHGLWRMPPGQYYLAAYASGTTFAGSLTLTSATKVDFVPNIQQFSTTDAYLAGVISVDAKDSVFAINGPAGASTITGGTISFISTFTDESALSPTPDFGSISTYRPVSCSVLCTMTAPGLVSGGNVAACLVSGGVADADFFVNQANSITGNLQNWEKLAGITEAYTGELKNGSYTYWKPEDYQDVTLMTPSQVLNHQYPTIIVSGVYNPQVTQTGTSTVTGVVRLKIVRNIEFTTAQTLWPKSRCVGSQAKIDFINGILAGMDSSMMNKTHLSFIQKVEDGIKKGASWLWKNRAPLLSAGKTIASLL